MTRAERDLVGPAGWQRFRLLTGALVAVTATQFVGRIGTPEYVLDGVLQRGFLYSLTGPTGAGKTAVAVALAAAAALGQRFAGRDTEPGRVLYVASENPADVAVRVLAWAQVTGVEVGLLDDGLRFVDQSFVLHEREEELHAVVEELAPSLVILDTDQAIAGSDDENANSERIAHAKRVRGLTRASSRPCVLDLCHPPAAATRASLRPRGGSAFLAEVDGNLGLWKEEGADVVEVFRHSKFRGPDFEPLSFTLRTVPVEAVKDSRARPMLSVVAVPATAEDDAREWKGARSRTLAVLRDVSMAPDASQRQRAESLGIPRATLQRVLDDLTRRGALRETLTGHDVTEKGKKWLVAAL
ncbi:MAG: AAA family ATPase [Burkholderiales bacterium]